ncbi:hypothetical protein BDL97_03G124600 [Sphagnum fallax]|nr:hypothetical protein BDL97_03G124600 [Sphagnum fallax]
MLGFVLYILCISSSMQLWYFHHCHTVCSCRGVIKIQAYLNDSRKHWICWKRVGCGQLGDLLYTLVPTLHQFLARLSDKICNTRRTCKTTSLSKNQFLEACAGGNVKSKGPRKTTVLATAVLIVHLWRQWQ